MAGISATSILVSLEELSANTNEANRPDVPNSIRKKAIIEPYVKWYPTNFGHQHVEFKILKD